MAAAVLVLVPVTLGLGLWQLDRAAQKRALEAEYWQNAGALPLAEAQRSQTRAFRRLRITGRFDPNRYFLVDNQVHRGRAGYTVIALFTSVGGERYLVNRGWVAGSVSRGELPEVEVPRKEVEILASAWPFTGLVPLLAEDPWSAGWPKRVQRANVARMREVVGGGFEHELRLELGQPGELERRSTAPSLAPERHMGYALQWFGLSVVLAVGFVVFGFARNRPRPRRRTPTRGPVKEEVNE